MERIYLSKSKYCKAKQCNKILWLDKNKPEESVLKERESVLEKWSESRRTSKTIF